MIIFYHEKKILSVNVKQFFSRTIAIIDNDIHIGNMLEEVLHKEDYQALRTYSGTEALYLLSSYHPDLMLPFQLHFPL